MYKMLSGPTAFKHFCTGVLTDPTYWLQDSLSLEGGLIRHKLAAGMFRFAA
jgi:hypothetical protein